MTGPKKVADIYWSYLPAREEIYERHYGLFLIHTWRPSTVPGQVADIVVQVHRHKKEGLPEATIERVEYDLGPHWPQRPMVRDNADQNFRLEISAYASALCVATLYFSDGKQPLQLYRYLDFS